MNLLRPTRSAGLLLRLSAAAVLVAPLPAGDDTPHLPTPVELPSGTPAEVQTLTPWDAQPGDRFGYALAASGDWLLASAPSDDLQGRDSGSVAAFRRGHAGWQQIDRLEPADGRTADYFGFSLTIEGNVAAIGAPWDDDRGDRTGSVYVFEWDGESWVERAKLNAFDAQPDDRFGHSVALDGGTLVVGARKADEGGKDNGAVYVFERAAQGWRPTAKLLAPDASEGAEFGFSVAIEDDLVAVGAWSDDPFDENDGSVHLFRRGATGWEKEAELYAAEESPGGCFGISVDLEGGRCAVGAPWESVDAPRAGAAYVFRYDLDHWVQETRVVQPDLGAGATFGIHVRLSGPELLVGSRFGSPARTAAGSVDVFRRLTDDWLPAESLFLEETREGDGFGLAVAQSGGWWLVGAKRAHPEGRRNGPGLVRAWRPRASAPEIPSGRAGTDSAGNGTKRRP